MAAGRRQFLPSILLAVTALAVLPGCGTSDGTPDASIKAPGSDTAAATSAAAGPVTLRAGQQASMSPAAMAADEDPVVVIRTNMGNITVQLDSKAAPLTVEHFLGNYVAAHFYDGTVFHYVQDGVMIIGGGYTPDLKLKEPRGEVFNEADNGLHNLRGTIAMARYPEARNSANSQFFINLKDNPALDHQDDEDDTKFGYCVFGKVIDGMDVVDKIAKVEVHDVDNFPNTPVEPVIIQSIRRIK